MQVRCNGVWISGVGDVADVEWSTIWRRDGFSGSFEASWTLDVSPDYTVPFLSRGADVELVEAGVTVWSGMLSEPERGRPWRLHATGYGAEAARYHARSGATATTVPDVAVDDAISRGMPLIRGVPLGSAPVGETDTGRLIWSVAEVLQARADQLGQRWVVGLDRQLEFAPDPTSPTWINMPVDTILGTADDDYVSHLWGYYVSATTGTPPAPSAWSWVLAADEGAAARWGREERVVDLTRLGLMTSAAAQEFVDGRLALAGGRVGYTNEIEVDGLSLRRTDQGVVNTKFLRAGEMMRLYGVADPQGNRTVGLVADIVIGRTVHRADTDVVRVAPLGMVPRSLSDVLAAPEPVTVEEV